MNKRDVQLLNICSQNIFDCEQTSLNTTQQDSKWWSKLVRDIVVLNEVEVRSLECIVRLIRAVSFDKTG